MALPEVWIPDALSPGQQAEQPQPPQGQHLREPIEAEPQGQQPEQPQPEPQGQLGAAHTLSDYSTQLEVLIILRPQRVPR